MELSHAFTHAVGVSLALLGQTILNNSLVNFDNLAYQDPNLPGFMENPINANGRQALMCVTDLVACCETLGLGNWYFPDGGIISDGGDRTFQKNRGENEVGNDQRLYGSVCIWHRFTPLERGLFHCEIPDSENFIHTLYVNVCEFPMIFHISVI